MKCTPVDVISLKTAIIRCLRSIVTTGLHTHRAFQVYLGYLQPLKMKWLQGETGTCSLSLHPWSVHAPEHQWLSIHLLSRHIFMLIHLHCLFSSYSLILSLKQETIPGVVNLAAVAGQLRYVGFAWNLLGRGQNA